MIRKHSRRNYNFFDARKKGMDLNDSWDQLLNLYKMKTKRNLESRRELTENCLIIGIEIETFLKEIALKKDLASENHLKFF